MKFDFDEMMELYQRSPEMFEQRRNELINEAIDRCSGPQQEALRKLQNELDFVRQLTPDVFIEICFAQITNNLERTKDAWKQIENICRETPY